MNIVQIVIFSIADILAILNLIREIRVLNSIKSKFICKNCKTFNKEISKQWHCESCKRRFEITTENWEHLLIHRVNWINTQDKNKIYRWKDYRVLPILEIAISALMITMFSLMVAINLYSILH